MKQDNDSLYLDSVIHDDHSVCGVLLQPLTLKLYSRLELIQSPLVKKHRNLEWEDLELAITLCSYKGNEPLNAIRSKSFWFGKRWYYKLWHLYNVHRRDILTEGFKFLDYVEDHTASPEVAEKEEEESSEGSQLDLDESIQTIDESSNPFPWFLLNQVALAKRTGWTTHYIEELTPAQIVWWNEAFSYIETGKTEFKSDAFNSLLDMAVKQREEREKAQPLTPS